MIKPVELPNISENFNLTNTKRYDLTNDAHRHLLYKQVVAWHCNGYFIASLTDHINSQIYQELPDEVEYDGNNSLKYKTYTIKSEGDEVKS